HGRPLSPRDAAEVVDLVHAKLGSPGRKVPIARLQDPDAGRFIIDCWEDAVAERDERASRPPVLQNTDGDPLLSVTDSFPFDAALRSEIESRLAAMNDIENEQRRKRESIWMFLRRSDRTVLGRVIVSRNILRIETNSERRADALGSRVREVCGSILNDSTRKTEDLSSTISASRRPGKPLPAKSPGEADLIRQLKAA